MEANGIDDVVTSTKNETIKWQERNRKSSEIVLFLRFENDKNDEENKKDASSITM